MQILRLLSVLLLAPHATAQTQLSADGLQFATGATTWRPNVWAQRRLLFEGRSYDAASPPPNMRYKDPLEVKLGLSVVKVEFDILSSTLTLGIWLRLKWLDERLLFDPEVVFGRNPDGTPAYGNETFLPMPMQTGDNVNIWIPDIYCVNATDSMESMHQEAAYIGHSQSDGYLNPSDGVPWNVFLSRPGTISVHCSPDLRAFPFDRPMCPLDFESWGFASNYLHLENMTEGWQSANDMPLSIDYEFDGQGAFTWNMSDTIDCDSTDPYAAASGTSWSKYRVVMHFKRLPSYHITHSVVPLTMVVILGALTFWLPINVDSSGSGERLGYTVTLLLTVIAIMLFTAEQRPAIAATTWLDKWQTRSLLLSTIPVIETIMIFWLQNMVANKDHMEEDDEPPMMGRVKTIAQQDKAMTKSAAKALTGVIKAVQRWMPKTLFLFLGPFEPMNIDNWFQILFPVFIVCTYNELPMEIINIVREKGHFVHGTQLFSSICVYMGIVLLASLFFVYRRFLRACREGCCGYEAEDSSFSGDGESGSEGHSDQCHGRPRDVEPLDYGRSSPDWQRPQHGNGRSAPDWQRPQQTDWQRSPDWNRRGLASQPVAPEVSDPQQRLVSEAQQRQALPQPTGGSRDSGAVRSR